MDSQPGRWARRRWEAGERARWGPRRRGRWGRRRGRRMRRCCRGCVRSAGSGEGRHEVRRAAAGMCIAGCSQGKYNACIKAGCGGYVYVSYSCTVLVPFRCPAPSQAVPGAGSSLGCYAAEGTSQQLSTGQRNGDHYGLVRSDLGGVCGCRLGLCKPVVAVRVWCVTDISVARQVGGFGTLDIVPNAERQ